VATLGTDFFPAVDAGQIKLHVRARSGLRVEETAALCDRIGEVIRAVIPPAEIESLIDNIGIPNSGVNLTYSNSAPIGVTDADISISLTRDHGDTADYVARLRERLPAAFPGVEFSFLPADMVSQILNLGLPAPIDVQVIGNNVEASRDVARRLMAEFRRIPGLVDLRIQQTFDRPLLQVDVDRTRAGDAGLTQREIAQDLLISLSGSSQTSPTFWLNPRTGVQYSVSTQTPQYRMTSLDALRSLPLGRDRRRRDADARPVRRHPLRDDAVGRIALQRAAGARPVRQRRRDATSAAWCRDLRAAIARVEADLPRGVRIETRGQMETMRSSFTGLYAGLALAILLVYLLLVVTFQSWTDALIIIAALPAAIAGILWCLFLTWTTLSVPALTGSILCMGVATANSILVDQLRARAARGRRRCRAGGARRRPCALPAGADDGARDDRRHAADGARDGRRRRAERTARPRRHRWPRVRDRRDAVLRSCRVRGVAPSPRNRRGEVISMSLLHRVPAWLIAAAIVPCVLVAGRTVRAAGRRMRRSSGAHCRAGLGHRRDAARLCRHG
jgi:multidrug efflux pump subunit AcrB